ncbi:MAG: DUF1573 domain-containing protein [Candidatus Bipolaricaulota bacterium]|nr:MAG: DUF1573 domain-containing protein [Candidatus Bipolaricaulota bacterium]
MRRAHFALLALLAISAGVIAAPQLEVDVLVYEAGVVVYGSTVSHTFVLTNTGDEVLTITQVRATCGCTTAAFPTPRVLDPGDSAELTASVNTNGFHGSWSKAVTILFHGEDEVEKSIAVQLKFTTRDVEQYQIVGSTFNNEFYLLIDLREPGQFEAGHILGAVNLPYAEIESWLERIPDVVPRGMPLFVYDADGTLSLEAVARLEAAGYDVVYGLHGGLLEWLRVFQDIDPLLSAPIELPEDYTGPGTSHANVEQTALELRKLLRLLVDVRTAELYAENHLLGAVNRPFEERESWLAELPGNMQIIFYGADGVQSDVVAQEAILAGYLQAYSLLGGLSEWITQNSELFLTSLGLEAPQE